jgi:membrane-bound lytic murein transglycosylase B
LPALPYRAADPSGLWGTLKEAAASSSALAAAERDPKSNELIKVAIADFETSEGRANIQNAMRKRFAQAEPAECVQRSLASLREVSAIVDAKAPNEAAAFKAWLRDISQKVAEAAVDGGVRVSDTETATLRDISKALGTAS